MFKFLRTALFANSSQKVKRLRVTTYVYIYVYVCIMYMQIKHYERGREGLGWGGGVRPQTFDFFQE